MPPPLNTSVPIGSFLAQQGQANLGQFTGLALGPNLVARAQGNNLAIDVPPSISQAVDTNMIFRPGTPSTSAHVETWAEIEALIAACEGLMTVYVDDSLAPAIVPASADTECFSRVMFSALELVPGTGGLLTIADGGRLRNPGVIQNNLVVRGSPSAISPLRFDARSCELRDGGVVSMGAGAAVPMIDVQSALFTLFIRSGGAIDNSNTPADPVLRMAAGTILFMVLSDGFFLFLNGTLVQGDATTALNLVHDATAISVPQSLLLGAFTEARSDVAEALMPSSGTTIGRPTTSFVGQAYFDTTLAIPIWWTGAAWVDAAGAPV